MEEVFSGTLAGTRIMFPLFFIPGAPTMPIFGCGRPWRLTRRRTGSTRSDGASTGRVRPGRERREVEGGGGWIG